MFLIFSGALRQAQNFSRSKVHFPDVEVCCGWSLDALWVDWAADVKVESSNVEKNFEICLKESAD